METYDFDIFICSNAEDKYMVENISQYFKDHGLRTFDRSVDSLPENKSECISEDEALSKSAVMLYVLTENSIDDSLIQDIVAKAIAAQKPIMAMRFGDIETPTILLNHNVEVIEGNRYDLIPVLKEGEKLLNNIPAK